VAGPPSDNIWIGFQEEPKIDVSIDTEVGESDFSDHFGMAAFPKQVGEIILGEMVLPEMESILVKNIFDQVIKFGQSNK